MNRKILEISNGDTVYRYQLLNGQWVRYMRFPKEGVSNGVPKRQPRSQAAYEGKMA